jgi:hypothetical protein
VTPSSILGTSYGLRGGPPPADRRLIIGRSAVDDQNWLAGSQTSPDSGDALAAVDHRARGQGRYFQSQH